METTELIENLGRGEDSRNQFKVNISNEDKLAGEIVAFSNSKGGRMFIGVNDDGSVKGLSNEDITRINALISNTASQNVRPAVNPITENVPHPAGIVLTVTIPEGVSKPYMDKNGVIWVKSGADKRRATAREEIQRLFANSGLIHADATPVQGMGISDLDVQYFEKFYQTQYEESIEKSNQSLPLLLENMNLTSQGNLNIAGALLFAKRPFFRLPAFIVKAVAFIGNDIEGENYIDSRDITGKLADVFHEMLGFITSNTRAPQGNQGVNSIGLPEVPRIVWEELMANALVHRDYFITAPVRILVFQNRVEIISPGHLPNNLTIENIKAGNSNIRNPILASFAAKILPYRGLGSGVRRALKAWPNIELIDDRSGNLFKAIVHRLGLSNQEGQISSNS